MSNLFNLLVSTNTINFLIVLFLIIYLVRKLKFKQKLNNLKDDIKSYVESSEAEKNEAKQSLQNVEDKIQKLPEIFKEIENSTKNSIKNLNEKFEEDILIQKRDIENNVKRLFNLETRKFQSKLSDILSLKSVDIAEQNAINQLNANSGLHNKYIENAISELDGINI